MRVFFVMLVEAMEWRAHDGFCIAARFSGESFHRVGELTTTAFHHSAQGCEERATLGQAATRSDTQQEVPSTAAGPKLVPMNRDNHWAE